MLGGPDRSHNPGKTFGASTWTLPMSKASGDQGLPMLSDWRGWLMQDPLMVSLSFYFPTVQNIF